MHCEAPTAAAEITESSLVFFFRIVLCYFGPIFVVDF